MKNYEFQCNSRWKENSPSHSFCQNNETIPQERHEPCNAIGFMLPHFRTSQLWLTEPKDRPAVLIKTTACTQCH
jgi:hypothetical protein